MLSRSAIAVATAALLFLLWHHRTDAARSVELEPRSPELDGERRGPGATDLENALDRPTRSTPSAALARWSVRVVVGETPFEDARLCAMHGEVVLEERGAARWSELAAGAWRLEVEAEGYARQELTAVLVAGRETETVVDLAAISTVRGRVRDHYGDPRNSHFVGLTPEGHPTPRSPRDWLNLPHARTDRRGEFTDLVAPAGRYRLFVGHQGRITYQDDEIVELRAAEAGSVDVVMRAPSRLLIEVHEAGSGATAPYGVSVYRDAAILDVERPLPPQVAPAPPPDPDDPALDVDDETREELRIAVADEQRELTPEERAAHERRMKVVPEGWRVDRSAICDAQGRLLLEFLPIGEELRFAVSRQGEALRVDASAWVDGVVPTRVRIELPPAYGADAELGNEPRTARALVSPVALPREPLEIGAAWTLPPR